MKLVTLIKTCLNKTYSKSEEVKIYMMHLLFKIIWNKEMIYYHCFSTLHYNMPSGRSKKMKCWNWMEHISSWSMMIIYWVKT